MLVAVLIDGLEVDGVVETRHVRVLATTIVLVDVYLSFKVYARSLHLVQLAIQPKTIIISSPSGFLLWRTVIIEAVPLDYRASLHALVAFPSMRLL